jgi:hypothetical protein
MKVTSEEIKNKLFNIDIKPLKEVKPQNLYIIKTKKGNVKIWSDLEPSEFYKTLKK